MIKIENNIFTVNVFDCRGRVNIFTALREMGALNNNLDSKILIIAGSEYAYETANTANANALVDSFDVEYYGDLCEYDEKEKEVVVKKTS